MGLSFYCPDGLSYCFGRYSGQRTQYSSLGPRQGTECRLRERYHSRARESRGNNAELVVRLVRWHLRFQESFIWLWEQDRPGSEAEAVQNPPESGETSERIKQRQQSVRAMLIFCSHPHTSAIPPAEEQSYFKSATTCSLKHKHFCDVTPDTTYMWFTCFVIWIWGEMLKTPIWLKRPLFLRQLSSILCKWHHQADLAIEE